MSSAHGAASCSCRSCYPRRPNDHAAVSAAHHDLNHHAAGLTFDGTTTMLLTMAIIAVIVYRHVGLKVLR